MEHLGFGGIIKLTIQIILRNLKHFLCIAFLLALPYALSFIVLGPSLRLIQPLVASISFLYKQLSASQGQLPFEETLISKQQHHSVSLLNVLCIFSIITSLLCLLLVAFSVCRACINKNLDLKGSLRGVRRSVINLGLTELLVVAVLSTFIVVAMVVMVIIGVGLSAVNANVTIPMTVMAVGVIGGWLYMAVALSLANTVAILEEKKGWEAMRRSMYLIKGSKGSAIGLYIFYGLLSTMALFVCVSEEAFVVWRWGVGGISVGLQAMVALCSLVSHVVLYMSCKSLHVEALDTLIAASVQFGPPQLAAKYLDLEAAAFATATQ